MTREKIVARPAEFRVGDVVQLLDTGQRWEVGRARSGESPGRLLYSCRPDWREDVTFPDDRDHVVERKIEVVEAMPHAEVKLHSIERIVAEDELSAAEALDLIREALR